MAESSSASSSTAGSDLMPNKLSMSTKRSSTHRPRRSSVLSHTSSMKRGQCDVCTDKRMEEMEKSIDRAELLEVAGKARGMKAHFGRRINGDLNFLLEIIFADKTTCFARISKPWRSSHPEETMHAQMSTYKYLKQHSSIPVPTVYAHALASDPGNKVGVSYMIIERMPGSKVPELVITKNNDERIARFWSQLSDILIELASFKFDTIGSISETSTGEFEVAPLYDFYTTYPLARGETDWNRGPYKTTTEYYNAVSDLNAKSTVATGSTAVDLEKARTELVRKMIPKFTELDVSGPFVLQHFKLNSDNILVDEQCNITGILSFPGVVGPLQNLARYPELIYQTKQRGPLFERKEFSKVWLAHDAKSGLEESPLANKEVRLELAGRANKTYMFEHSLLYPAHKTLHLAGKGGLYEFVFSQPDELTLLRETEFPDIPKTHALTEDAPAGEGTKYSWQTTEGEKKKDRKVKDRLSGAWAEAPWIKGRREEERIREYVRVHKHLPPGMKAVPGKRRNNGPEKAFAMAWKFVKCR